MAALLCCFGVVVWLGAKGAAVSGQEMNTVQPESAQEECVQNESVREEGVREERIPANMVVEVNNSTLLSGGVEHLLFTTERIEKTEGMVVLDTVMSGGGNMEIVVLPTDEPEQSEYANLAIADVNAYVNVRKEPNTDCEVVGKMYDGAVAQILSVAGEQGDWFQITSGNVEGYIKAEYFIYGDAAAEVIDEYVTRYAQVNVTRLNVRKEPSTENNRIGYIDSGEKVKLLEDCGEWLKVQYTSGKEGYVAAEYVMVVEEFTYAKTLEEEQAEIAAQRALEERQKQKEKEAAETLQKIEFPATTYTSNEELRKAIIEYAMQYVGNKYVSGGKSLAGGTDCSGFTCFIYADFGYSISRTPEGQYSSAGRSIDYSAIQPGDIICHSTNGGRSCTHVSLYIGNGQIVHSANPRKGVVIADADCEPIIGIRNVID